MIRYNYLEKIKTENNIDFYDLTKLNWNEFQFKRSYKTHILSGLEIDKFYSVVNLYYADLLSEDIIYFVNKISDPTTLVSGQEIYIPDIRDINDFITSQLRVRF